VVRHGGEVKVEGGMSEEMVERVARALAETAGDHTPVVGSKARRQARAALAEIGKTHVLTPKVVRIPHEGRVS
jgi:hypothetical protein